jgi:subtilisin
MTLSYESEGIHLKILIFHPEDPFSEIISELKAKVKTPQHICHNHTFHNISCLCVPKTLFSQHEKLFMSFNPLVEENLTVKVHSKPKEEIPWGVKYMGVEKRWKKGLGQGVRVAVIDTGIDGSHPDLKDQVKGGVKLVKGPMNGHGTHVAGTIAAIGKGIYGVAPAASLYDVRAFDSSGNAAVSDIIKGIDWSIKNNMQVVNMSFGMPESSQALERIVEQANRSGITLVASAGNNGGALDYPARYAGVTAVGAIDENGKLAKFSSHGIGMNKTAPGVNIFSAWPGGEYKTLDGTSMAAAHMSGLAALLIGNKMKR